MPDSFKFRLKRLVITKKLILAGSLLAIIGVLLPWYSDIDKFKTGDMFLGITGPLYLAGLIVFLAGLGCFGIILLKLLQKPVPKLPLKEEHFYLGSGVLAVFMLIMSASVFFHNKFGINLINKSMGSGMWLAFIGACLVIAGSAMLIKKGDVDFEGDGHLNPLIEIDTTQREQRDLTNEKEHSPQPVQDSLTDIR